jgi:hypothetical protein
MGSLPSFVDGITPPGRRHKNLLLPGRDSPIAAVAPKRRLPSQLFVEKLGAAMFDVTRVFRQKLLKRTALK